MKKITIEEIHKEIDLVQACITRMADNSFRLKEWYISLIAIALTVLISQNSELLIIGMFLLIVSLVFWGLDGYYLKMETLYRWKYDWILVNRKKSEKKFLYNLNPHNRQMWLDADQKKVCLLYFVFSKTLIPLYGAVCLGACIIIIYAIIKH